MPEVDRLISSFDRGLRTLFGPAISVRETPGEDFPEREMDESQRRHAAALMRVNHTGEVCAQALYQGQALTARGSERARRARARGRRGNRASGVDASAYRSARRPQERARSAVVRRLVRHGRRQRLARRSLEPGVSRGDRAAGGRASRQTPEDACRPAGLRAAARSSRKCASTKRGTPRPRSSTAPPSCRCRRAV